jgi:uncharacterized membrane protein YjgN (DUF898 family)
MFNQYISRDALSIIAVFIFLILFGIINAFRPSIIYNNDLSFRRFGIGYKNKTVIPIWLMSIVLAILVYVLVTYLFEYRAVD